MDDDVMSGLAEEIVCFWGPPTYSKKISSKLSTLDLNLSFSVKRKSKYCSFNGIMSNIHSFLLLFISRVRKLKVYPMFV
jgi:hypothetical protein